MEYPQLGRSCALGDCNQLDFLPFQCAHCSQAFCLQHVSAESHRCASKKSDAVQICPLCRTGIREIQQIEAHIANECTGTPKVRSKLCAMERCGKREVIPCTCQACGLSFCFRHRHPGDHLCKAPLAEPNEQKTRMLAHLPARSSAEPPSGAAPKKEALRPLLPGESASPQRMKQLHMAAKVQLMKLKINAKGDDGIPQESRVYQRVLLPLESASASCNLFFDKNWTIGRVLDKAASFAKISNRNNEAGLDPAARLGMFSSTTGAAIPANATLESLMAVPSEAEKVALVINGGNVIMERGQHESVEVARYLERAPKF